MENSALHFAGVVVRFATKEQHDIYHAMTDELREAYIAHVMEEGMARIQFAARLSFN